MRGLEDRVVGALTDQVDLLCALELGAMGEVVDIPRLSSAGTGGKNGPSWAAK